MRAYWACLVLGSIGVGVATMQPLAALAQVNRQRTTPPSGQAHESNVGPDSSVITIKGVCPQSTGTGQDCKTLVSREQFEKLVKAVQPNMPPPLRRQFAITYARGVRMAAAAEKRGLDKQPSFDELLRFARIQILAQQLSRTLQEEADKISDDEVADYYNKHISDYEEASFIRIFVPSGRQKAESKPESNHPEVAKQSIVAQDEMARLASRLRGRAADGDDPDALQREAFVAAGVKQTPPNTRLEKVRRMALSPAHRVAFALQPQEVSPVILDPTGYFIYKLVSKEAQSLDSVREEIRDTISADRFRVSMQRFQNGNTELNDTYFGPAATQASPALREDGKPSDEPAVDPD